MRERLSAFIFVCFVVLSCSTDKLDVDVSTVDFNLELFRFEQEMFAANSAEELSAVNQELLEQGSELYEFYLYDMVRLGNPHSDSIGFYLLPFVQDSIMKMVVEDIDQTFGDFKAEFDLIIDAFKHLKYHIPNINLPEKLITYNSTFSYGVVSHENMIGIGLEMYLGESNDVIKEIRLPNYMKSKMNKTYLPVDVARSWLTTSVLEDVPGETFLNNLIYYGKLHYFIEAMMPNQPKEVIIRYTQEEYDYALASEYNIWQYLVEMDWIYTTDMKVKLRFFEPAPTTVGIDDSPGRIGQFMGWQMVRSYMDTHPEVSLQELLKETSNTKILKAYKPRSNE